MENKEQSQGRKLKRLKLMDLIEDSIKIKYLKILINAKKELEIFLIFEEKNIIKIVQNVLYPLYRWDIFQVVRPGHTNIHKPCISILEILN